MQIFYTTLCKFCCNSSINVSAFDVISIRLSLSNNSCNDLISKKYIEFIEKQKTVSFTFYDALISFQNILIS